MAKSSYAIRLRRKLGCNKTHIFQIAKFDVNQVPFLLFIYNISKLLLTKRPYVYNFYVIMPLSILVFTIHVFTFNLYFPAAKRKLCHCFYTTESKLEKQPITT